MKLQLLPLSMLALLCSSSASLTSAHDSIVRKPDAVIHTGDTLAINIAKILGAVDKSDPNHSRLRTIELADQRELTGFPITVLEDGTVSVPLIKPLHADGLTVGELEKSIGDEYIRMKILRSADASIVIAKSDDDSSTETSNQITRLADAVIHTGDILAINIAKVLGPVEKSNPHYSRLQIISLENHRALTGFPIPVFKDGTISLPLIAPLRADGLTVEELEKSIAKEYIRMKILRSDEASVVVAKPSDQK